MRGATGIKGGSQGRMAWLSALLVPLSSVGVALQSGPAVSVRPIEALDLYRLEQPVDPQLSPDGRTVAVLRQTRDINTDRVNHELWLVSVADGARRMLVGADRSPGGARWSPDGTRLAFIGREGGKPQVMVVDVADGRARAVTDAPQPPRSLAWSPDSRALAYVALVEQQPEPFYALPEKPAAAQWAPPPRIVRDYPYRTDSSGYLAPGEAQVFVVGVEADVPGAAPRQITRGAGWRPA